MRWGRSGGRDLVIPAARRVDLVTTEADGEVLVYDRSSHHIHHLNVTTARVWHACDGRRSVETIAAEANVTPDTARQALTKLADARLLDGPLPAGAGVAGSSRRSFVKRAGVAAIPAIVSVTAPLASAHASTGNEHCVLQGLLLPGEACNSNLQCCSQTCNQPFPGGPGICA